MAQLNPNQYKRLTKPLEYGVSDGLYWDATNSLLVLVIDDTVKAKFPLTQTSGTVMVSDGTDTEPVAISGDVALTGAGAATITDLSVASEARGDILRRGATAWAAHSAKASGQILVGDGTDIASVAVTGDVTISGSGVTAIGATKVLASMLGANLAKGFIPLDLFSVREAITNALQAAATGAALGSGGILATDTTPILERVNGATDKAARVRWAASDQGEIQFAPFAYPPDLDDTAAVEVHLLVGKDGNTDSAAVIAVDYFEGLGDSNAGTNTSALSTATITEYTVTIAAGNVGPHPTAASVALIPGAHTTDAIHLYAAWIEYTRKS